MLRLILKSSFQKDAPWLGYLCIPLFLFLLPTIAESKVCQASHAADSATVSLPAGEVAIFKSPVQQLLQGQGNLGQTCLNLRKAIHDARQEYARLLKKQTYEHYRSEAAARARIEALGANDPMLREELKNITVDAGISAEEIAMNLGKRLEKIEELRARANRLAKGIPQIRGNFPDKHATKSVVEIRDAAAKEWGKLKQAADQIMATGRPLLDGYKATAGAFQGTLPSMSDLRRDGLVGDGAGAGNTVTDIGDGGTVMVDRDGTGTPLARGDDGCSDAECEMGVGKGKIKVAPGGNDGVGDNDPDAQARNAERLGKVVAGKDGVEYEGDVKDEYKTQAEKELAAFDEGINKGAIKAHLEDPDADLKDETTSVLHPLDEDTRRGKLALDVKEIAGAKIEERRAEVARVEGLLKDVKELTPAQIADPSKLDPALRAKVEELNQLRVNFAASEQAVLDARYKAILKHFPDGRITGFTSSELATKEINRILDADPDLAAARAAYAQNPLTRVIAGTEIAAKRNVLGPITANEIHLDQPIDSAHTSKYGQDRLPVISANSESDDIPDSYNIRLARGPSPEVTAETKSRLELLERFYDNGKGMEPNEYELERQRIIDGVTKVARKVEPPLTIAELNAGVANANQLLDAGETMLKEATYKPTVENLTEVCKTFTAACGAAVYKDSRLDPVLSEVRAQVVGDSVARQYWADVKEKGEIALSVGGLGAGIGGMTIRVAAAGTGRLATAMGTRLGALTSSAMTTTGLASMFGGSALGVSNAVDSELFEANTLARLKTDGILNGLDPAKAAAISAQYEKVIEAQGRTKLAKGMFIADIATGAGGKVLGVSLDAAADLGRRVRGGGHTMNRDFTTAVVNQNLAITDDAARLAAMRNGDGLTGPNAFNGIRVGPDGRQLTEAEAKVLLGVHNDLGKVSGKDIGYAAVKEKYDSAVAGLVKSGMPVEDARDAASQCIRAGLCGFMDKIRLGGAKEVSLPVGANTAQNADGRFAITDLTPKENGRYVLGPRSDELPGFKITPRSEVDPRLVTGSDAYTNHGIQTWQTNGRIDYDRAVATYIRGDKSHGSGRYIVKDGQIQGSSAATPIMPPDVHERASKVLKNLEIIENANRTDGKKLVVTGIDVRVWKQRSPGTAVDNPYDSAVKFHMDGTPVEYIITEKGPGTLFRLPDGRIAQACEGELCRIMGSNNIDSRSTQVGLPHATPADLGGERMFIKFSTALVDAD